MSKLPHVRYLTATNPGDRPTITLSRLVERACELGHEIALLSPKVSSADAPGTRLHIQLGGLPAPIHPEILMARPLDPPGARLLVAFRPDLVHVATECDRPGIGGVHLAGYRKGEALAAAYASGDAFVFPSDSETFGNVVMEAFASGLPVISVNEGGVKDLVQPGVTGALVPRGTPTRLPRRPWKPLPTVPVCVTWEARHARSPRRGHGPW